MQIRRFSADLKTKIPGGHFGLYGVPIQFDSSDLFSQNMEELARRLNGLPILLNRPMIVVAMYLEPHASMDEHSSKYIQATFAECDRLWEQGGINATTPASHSHRRTTNSFR